MLEYLGLRNVGPAEDLELELAPRLNLITGDNGLGKSFLLDVAWWALSGRWPAQVNPRVMSGDMARPTVPSRGKSSILYQLQGSQRRYMCGFDRRAQQWSRPPGRPAGYGLVVYAQVDGGFTIWDPLRNVGRSKGFAEPSGRQPAFVFTPREVWDGLRSGDTQVCNGLLADWALWQKEQGEVFQRLVKVLRAVSPAPDDQIVIGALTKLSIDDARWMPTLVTPYGGEVPLTLASAAVRRIAALAYLLVWSWEEHLRASLLLGERPAQQVVFLVDEIECHLHPRWQRTILRSVLEVMRTLAGEVQVQVLAATQSPLVLASAEPFFDPAQDAWFDLDLEPRGDTQEVVLRNRQFVRRGDVSNWLTSEAFDLRAARSLESEQVLEEAAHALSDESFDRSAARALDAKLRGVLGGTDPFWSRWRFVGERRGWWPGTDDESASRRRPRKKKVSKPRSRRS